MTCGQCGAALQDGSGFCGACGRQQPAQQQQWQPPQQQQWQQQQPQPPQQQQWQQQQQQQQPPQQPWQQQQQPPQQPWQQQQQPQHQWQQQQQPPQQPWQQQQPPQQQPWPQPHGPTLMPFPLIMQRRITRLTGHLFLAPTRLYFLCESTKGGLGAAIGQGLGGLVGGAIMALAAPKPGEAAPMIDEAMLQQAVQQKEGSMIIEPAKIKHIKETMWLRGLWYDGTTYGFPKGLSKELNHQLALWCQANNVKNKGLKLTPPKA